MLEVQFPFGSRRISASLPLSLFFSLLHNFCLFCAQHHSGWSRNLLWIPPSSITALPFYFYLQFCTGYSKCFTESSHQSPSLQLFFPAWKSFPPEFPTFSLLYVIDGYLNTTPCNSLPLRFTSLHLLGKFYVCLYVPTFCWIRAFCSSSLPNGHSNSKRVFALREGT